MAGCLLCPVPQAVCVGPMRPSHTRQQSSCAINSAPEQGGYLRGAQLSCLRGGTPQRITGFRVPAPIGSGAGREKRGGCTWVHRGVLDSRSRGAWTQVCSRELVRWQQAVVAVVVAVAVVVVVRYDVGPDLHASGPGAAEH